MSDKCDRIDWCQRETMLRQLAASQRACAELEQRCRETGEELDTLEARRVHVEREWLAKYQDMEAKWATAVAFGCAIEAERDALRVERDALKSDRDVREMAMYQAAQERDAERARADANLSSYLRARDAKEFAEQACQRAQNDRDAFGAETARIKRLAIEACRIANTALGRLRRLEHDADWQPSDDRIATIRAELGDKP
jgi:chromosome segregation ATPase